MRYKGTGCERALESEAEKGRHAHQSLDCVPGFQASVGRRDLDRTLGTSLNLEANIELLTDSIQRQYGCFRGTHVQYHRRMGRGARRWGWGTEVCGGVWLCFTPVKYHLPSGTTLWSRRVEQVGSQAFIFLFQKRETWYSEMFKSLDPGPSHGSKSSAPAGTLLSKESGSIPLHRAEAHFQMLLCLHHFTLHYTQMGIFFVIGIHAIKPGVPLYVRYHSR